ncbi:MAG: hypothetical protein ACE5GE_06830 [Phycisphaerae bacterium]
MSVKALVACGLMLSMVSGCALKEIRSKSKFGSEFRHSGTKNTNKVRYTVQQGFDFKWDKGITTGVTYRRRDDDDGGGDNDNGVWFSVSFPLWKAKPKADTSEARIERLERRLAALEADQRTRTAMDRMAGDEKVASNRPG